MPSIPIVIIVAAAREAAAVRRALSVRARRRLEAGPGWAGESGASTVALVQAGFGPERAAAAGREALEAFRPGALLALGFAGALRSGIAPGTLVLAETTRPEGGAGRAGDARLLDAARAAAAAASIPSVRGELVSSVALVRALQAKAALAAASGAVAVDMEAAGVAGVAAAASLPFLAAKIILDAADEPLHPILMDVVRPDGAPRICRAAYLAARDAEARAALRWAGRRSRLAARILTRFCRTLFPILGCRGVGLGAALTL